MSNKHGTYIQTVKKQIDILRTDLGMLYLLTAAVWFVFYLTIDQFLNKEETTSSVTVACIVAVLSGGIYFFIVIVSSLQLMLQTELSMGCTRKNFFASYISVIYLAQIPFLFEVYILYFIEKKLLQWQYGREVFDLFNMANKYFLEVLILVPAILVLASILIMKYGRYAGVPCWILWMMMCLFPGRIMDAMETEPNSVLAKIGTIFHQIFQTLDFTMVIALLLSVLVAAFLLMISYKMLKKQQVW